MPELPEIEIVKRILFKTVNKAKIIDIKINNKNLRYKISNTFQRNLIGEKILKVSRRSKYLLFHLKKKILLIHFGMTGKILVMKNSNNKIYRTSFYYDLNILKKHNHIYIKLNNGSVLVYNDVRRFGFFKIFKNLKSNKIAFLEKLGHEPFSKKFNSKYFLHFVKNKKKCIKSLLMDQRFVSGLGNIYVNEALFAAKIQPLRSCNKLNKSEINDLISKIQKILRLAILKGGSSIKNFQSARGKSGSFQQFFNVYGQKNKDCSRISCKGKIKKIVISNRATFYCHLCQI